MKDTLRARLYHEGFGALEAGLSGPARSQIVAEVAKSKSFDRAARHLRDGMRAHRFESGGQPLFSGIFVRSLDRLTREDGFHVLNDWDGQADRFRDDIIPAEAADLAGRIADPAGPDARRAGLAVLLDYYCLHLVGLLALRAWDHGDPDANLDALNRLLDALQGEGGSGQKFASDAMSLILIITSHFEPDVTAYERLRLKIGRLSLRHRRRLALTHAAILGCHLRFGLEVTCAGSVSALREDNVPDYPWLCDALATLLETEPGTAPPDERASEALMLGLIPDAEAFLGAQPPDSLAASSESRNRIRELFPLEREALRRRFAGLRPREDAYSPFHFTFNFPHNLVKGMVMDAVLRGRPWSLGLEDLLTSFPRDPDLDRERQTLARRLMGYAIQSPDIIRGRPHPAIVYDPKTGLAVFDRFLARL